jgi:hypothetical protein
VQLGFELTSMQRFLYFRSGFNTTLAISMIYLLYCPVIYLLGQGLVKIATFDTYECLYFFTPYTLLQFVCMRISYREVPKVYLRRSFQKSVLMLFCYDRPIISIVLGIKVSWGGAIDGYQAFRTHAPRVCAVSVRVQLGFKMTSKDADTSESRKSFIWCIPFFMYYLLGSLSLGWGAQDVLSVPGARPRAEQHAGRGHLALVGLRHHVANVATRGLPPAQAGLQARQQGAHAGREQHLREPREPRSPRCGELN